MANIIERTMGRKRRNHDLPPRLECKKAWYYYVAMVNGKQRWFSLKTNDKYLALKRWSEIEAKRAQQAVESVNISINAGILFKELAERYLKEIIPYKSDGTQRVEKRWLTNLVTHFGKKPIKELTRVEIIKYLDSLRDIPYEANHRLSLIRHMLRKACDWGDLLINPAAGVAKFKEKRHKLQLTTDVLFGQIYPVAHVNLKKAIMLGFQLVQHEKEVKKLTWSNIDMEKREVRFTREKTDEELAIHINDTLYKFLLYCKSQRRDLSNCVIYHIDTKTKKFVPYRSFRSMWKKALNKAGIEPGKYKFKELRHLANTCMKDQGVVVDKRVAVTGHRSISANEIYTHISATDSVEATKSLEQFSPPVF